MVLTVFKWQQNLQQIIQFIKSLTAKCHSHSHWICGKSTRPSRSPCSTLRQRSGKACRPVSSGTTPTCTPSTAQVPAGARVRNHHGAVYTRKNYCVTKISRAPGSSGKASELRGQRRAQFLTTSSKTSHCCKTPRPLCAQRCAWRRRHQYR